MKQNNKKAFSLIELIFVIVVIGIIAAIAIPKLMNTKDEAVISTIKQDISIVIGSVQSYYMLNGSISKFSDAVSLSSKNWSGIDTKKIEFQDNGNNCVSIEIVDKNLNITITPTVGSVCQKISNLGVKTESFTLN